MCRKVICLILLLSLLAALCACGDDAQETQPTTLPTIPVTEPTVPAPTDPPPTEEPTVAETTPAHSPLYIPGLEAEDVIRYFNEVCLDAEISNSGDATRLQKWTIPIVYTVIGKPTADDLALLSDFTAWLNTIDGFPGISETDDPLNANLRLHFCSQQDLLDLMGSHMTGLDGAVTFWYDNDEIYDAIICVRTDLDQNVRNSVILEEIYNGLGPIQDTALRPDSIIYSDYAEPQDLTQIDELILTLLYNPDLLCGMDAQECEVVIRQLYY